MSNDCDQGGKNNVVRGKKKICRLSVGQLNRTRHAADNSGMFMWMFTRTNHLHAAASFVPPLGKGKYPPMMKQIFRISRSERSTSRAYYVTIHILTHTIPLRGTLVLSFHRRLRLLSSGFPRKSKNGILTDRLRVT